MKRLAFVLLFVIAACASTTEDKIVVACQTYASSLSTLAVAKAAGDLSDAQIATVNDVRAILNPICQEGRWSNADVALSAVEQGIVRLAQVKGGS